MNETELRVELVRIARRLDAQGLNRGSSGNLSARCRDGMLITPSGMGADDLTAEDVVFVDEAGQPWGKRQPSSEWLFHRDIYAQRAEFGAVIHTHSVAATALACMRKDIPPLHYIIAMAGGDSIRCAGYATFGTQALSDAVLVALRERRACLLANHGMIAAGVDMAEAFKLAVEVEMLAELYLRTLQAGESVLLTAEEFRQAQQQFADLRYGETQK
ncbi:MAG: class II aldolase/adducin family protein [Gallionella sp.]|nr:class II aldolase/adducin family protein [Gallionella sp.]